MYVMYNLASKIYIFLNLTKGICFSRWFLEELQESTKEYLTHQHRLAQHNNLWMCEPTATPADNDHTSETW